MGVATGDRAVEFPAFATEHSKRDELFRESIQIIRTGIHTICNFFVYRNAYFYVLCVVCCVCAYEQWSWCASVRPCYTTAFLH